jgi:mannonate dehydratase
MISPLHPWQNLQRRFFLNAACAQREGSVDEDFVGFLARCLDAFPPGAKAMLLAFDFHHDGNGVKREDLSVFHIPDRYAAEVARRFPERFEWICSVHPYRGDAVEALESAAKNGARATKWLPSSMGIDPASDRCDRYYAALVRLGLPLLAHAGEEQAVHGAHDQELNNPLRLRRALDHGVRVIVAHCASLGAHTDLDRSRGGAVVHGFDLFTRLMNEPRYDGRLFGDISAITQINRVDTALTILLNRSDWHPRLVNGSDYPMSGVMPILSIRKFVAEGYLQPEEGAVLADIRKYNSLLFDFVLKRSLVRNGRRFAPVVFESRRLFDRRTAVVGEFFK